MERSRLLGIVEESRNESRNRRGVTKCGRPSFPDLRPFDTSTVRMVASDVISKLEARAAKAVSTDGSADAARIMASIQLFRQQKAALAIAQALQLQLQAPAVPPTRMAEPSACAKQQPGPRVTQPPQLPPCTNQTAVHVTAAAAAAGTTHGHDFFDLSFLKSDSDDESSVQVVGVVPPPSKLASASLRDREAPSHTETAPAVCCKKNGGASPSAAEIAPAARCKKEEPATTPASACRGDAPGPSTLPASIIENGCPDLPKQYAHLLGQYSGYEGLLDTVFLATGEPTGWGPFAFPLRSMA